MEFVWPPTKLETTLGLCKEIDSLKLSFSNKVMEALATIQFEIVSNWPTDSHNHSISSDLISQMKLELAYSLSWKHKTHKKETLIHFLSTHPLMIAIPDELYQYIIPEQYRLNGSKMSYNNENLSQAIMNIVKEEDISAELLDRLMKLVLDFHYN